MSKANGKDKQENYTPFAELCRYADQYHLVVEIEKPFQQFDQLFLKLIDADGKEVHRIMLTDISVLNKESASLLNELSKTKH